MNTLTKPILQKSIKGFLHVSHLRRKRLIECKHEQPLDRPLAKVDAVQDSAPEIKSPSMKRRPLPPAKPPVRFARA